MVLGRCSNFEKKSPSKFNICHQAGLEDEIEEVLVPTEEVIEVRRGKEYDRATLYARIRFGAHGDVHRGYLINSEPRHRFSGRKAANADARCK